ncbi:MAG: hypothetical protein V1928_03775 [Parcubacteria group bacterium]
MSEKDKNDHAGTDDFNLRVEDESKNGAGVDSAAASPLPKVVIDEAKLNPPALPASPALLPLAENKLEEQFFSGGVKSKELHQIQCGQSEEAARLEAEEKRLAEIRLELVEKENELEYLQNSLMHRHWDFQQFFAVKLRLSRDENKELRRKAQLAEERLARSGVHVVQVIEALNAQAEAKLEKTLARKREELESEFAEKGQKLDEQVEIFARAFHELYAEKELSKAFRAKQKKWYKEKLAAELAKLQVPAAASLPYPLADALLNAKTAAEIPLPAERISQPPPLPTSEPVKTDDEKVPAWMIGAIISGVALIAGLIAAAVAI